MLEATLARIERVNPTLNAMVTLNERADDEARARGRARSPAARSPGPLCGLPVGIKDVTPVAGLRTTFGSPLFADHVPDRDALIVRRLRRAGAVIVGKTNCPEFAAGGNTFNEVFGRTRNPWDPSKSAGGSTGGGAAALATGMIALAEGTDLGGSLRIPGVVLRRRGIRPVARAWCRRIRPDYLWDTLQVTGPMARTADDVALMLQAIAGCRTGRRRSASRWPAATSSAAVRAGMPRGLRVAYCADLAASASIPTSSRSAGTRPSRLREPARP